MFDHLIESRRDGGHSRLRASLLIAATLHGVVLGAILVRGALRPPPSHERPVRVTFAPIAPRTPPAGARPVPRSPVVTPRPKPQNAAPAKLVEPPPTPRVLEAPEPPKEDLPKVVSPGGAPGEEAGARPEGAPAGSGAAAPATAVEGPLRIGGDVWSPVIIEQVDPDYPALAHRARVEGVVVLEAVIRRNGTVGDIRVVQGLRLGCTQAAVDALRHWRFKPGRRNGVPVDVFMDLTVRFRLE